jgi:acetyl-CoA C-acetyltransferase
MIGFPYPKLMNSNIQVDQAAAVIVCSVEAATALGIPSDQWVFLHAGADAHDHWFVTDRWSIGRSPAIGACGKTAFGLAGKGVDDVAHVDLYSCFPSAVEVAGIELGIDVFDPSRPPTVTGGLCFGGGPGNNYVTHSIAAMVERLRANPGDLGVVTANGWYLTKHSIGLYSTEPPTGGFKWESAQGIVDASPKREAAEVWEGPVTVEAWTVLHERDGSPQLGIVGGLLEDGRRTWANTSDADLLQVLVTQEVEGRAATVSGGQLSLA